MAKYIYKGEVVENNQPYDEIVRSYLLEENEFAHVIISDEMVELWQSNNTLSIEQIFYLENISEEIL